MATSTKFLIFCRMTCVGGSENGECPCKHPKECAFRDTPEYAEARRLAVKRMADFIKGKVEPS